MNWCKALVVALLIGCFVFTPQVGHAQPRPPASNACREPVGGPVTITTQIGHFISDLVVNSTEDLAVSHNQSGTLKVWALEPRHGVGPIVRTIATGNNIWDLTISSDGRRVATAHDDAICIWDLETGRPALALRDKDQPTKRVRSVVFANDDRWLVSAGDDGSVRIWNSSTGKMERLLHKQHQQINKLVLAPGGTMLVSGDEEGWLRLWTLPDGGALWAIRTATEPVRAIAVSEKIGVVASGGGVAYVKKGKDPRVRLWDLKGGHLLTTLPSTTRREEVEGLGDVRKLAFATDGEQLIIEDGVGASIWSTREKRFLRQRPFYRNILPLNHSRSFLLTERADQIVQISNDWQKIVRRLQPAAEAADSVELSPDGRRLVSLSTDTLCLWNLVTGERIACRQLDHARTQGAMGQVGFTLDSNRLILHLEAGEIEALDGHSLSSIWRRPYPRSGDAYYPIKELRIATDGRIVAAASDRTFRVFDAADGALTRTVGADDRELRAAWISPDAAFAKRIHVVSNHNGGPDQVTLTLLDLTTALEGSSVPLMSNTRIFGAWFIPSSGGILTLEGPLSDTTDPGELVLRDGVTGQPRRTIDRITGSISAVRLTPDGRYLAAGMEDEGYAIKVWDLVAGGPPIVLKGHEDRISGLTFTVDGKRLVSTSSDGIKVWSLPRRTLAATMYTSPGADWVTMTPAGFFAAGGKTDHLISIVQGFDSYPVQHLFETLYRPDLMIDELAEDREAKHAAAAAALSLDRILRSGQAPALELLEDGTERLFSAVRVRVRIKDEGGGIGPRVIWRVNGQVRAVSEVPHANQGSGDAVVAEQVLKIVPGVTHTVQVVAYNRVGLLASLPLTFPISVEGAVSQETRMHVLAIGITEYEKKDWRLNLAAGDAKAFAAALELAGKGLFSRIKTTLVLDKEATANGIGAAFAKIAHDPDVQPNDVFVLYVAGHGRYDGARYFLVPQDLDTDLPPKGKGHIITFDAINQETLQRWIASIQVDKRLVILDTCESAQGGGTVIRGLASPRLSAMEQLQHATGDNLIAAAGQAAFESSKLGHGLLTYAVLEAFARRQGSSSEEKVTTDTVATQATDRVPELSREIFGQVQWPIRKMSSGVPIPLGFRRLGLSRPEIPDPVRRNFILMRDELVRTRPDAAALTDPVMTLVAPMIVHILGYNEAGDWMRIQWGEAVNGTGAGVGWVPTSAVREPNRAPKS